MGQDTEWIDVTCLRESPSGKAWLVTNGSKESWIPKSQVIDEEEELRPGLATKIELPAWLLESEELV